MKSLDRLLIVLGVATLLATCLAGPSSAGTTAGAAGSAVLRTAAGVARWGDCQPIPYVINPAGAPAGWTRTVANALQQASRGTGYSFTYAGTTTSRMAGPANGSPAVQVHNAISFIWNDSRQAAYLPAEGADTLLDLRSGVITGAAVVLNLSLKRDPRAWVIPQVLLHEVGHAMGLMHVGDHREIMYPVQSHAIHGYQAGDLAGLHRVGVSAGPCVAHAAPTVS